MLNYLVQLVNTILKIILYLFNFSDPILIEKPITGEPTGTKGSPKRFLYPPYIRPKHMQSCKVQFGKTK